MQQPFILGIDIGTGSTKAVAVNFSGEPFLTAQAFYSTDHPRPGYSEQDPEVIWKAFLDCTRDIRTRLGTDPAGISLSSAMHSVIPVNGKGQAMCPMITWADARSAAIADRIRSARNAELIYKTTGTPIHAMSPLSKIIWIREHEPDIFASAFKFISIKEYIWFRLFDSYEVDHSIASGMGLFDIHRFKWSTEAMALAGITGEHLSIPVSTSYTRFDFTPPPGAEHIPAGMAFTIGGSDGCLANLGSLAIEPGVAAITIGTSGAVRVANTLPVYNFSAMTFNYRLDEETFICGGPVNNGGIAIQWLMKNLLGYPELTGENYRRLFNEIAEAPAGAEGLIFLPYVTGERAPAWDTQSAGVFLGARLHHYQRHFARAVLEGVCFGLYQVLEAVESGSGPVQRIHLSGGFIQSETWVSVLSDITGKQLGLIQAEDASALGAAMIAMKSLGIIKDYSPFLKGKQLATVDPDMEKHQKYQVAYQVYKQLYPLLKDAMHLLHQAN